MKLTVIGGGGVRSMFLAKTIAQQAASLGITQLVFMDNDPEKLRIFGGMAAHVAKLLAPSLSFITTADPRAAVRDADYIITTIRVGGDEMRCRDEHAALSLGVLGQETTGAAGFSFAMRSVPALVYYCRLAKQLAKPNVKIFNFTNPVGIVSQALRDMGFDFTYGICDAPSGMLHQFAKLYNADPERMGGELFGLNHLSWFHSITLDGREIMPELLERPDAYAHSDMRFFPRELTRLVGCVPNEYLYYFYNREQAIANILKAGKTRGDIICEINQSMIAQLSGMDPDKDFDGCMEVFKKWYGLRESLYMANETGVKRAEKWDFDPFAKDAGGYAGVALRFIQLSAPGRKGKMILCVPNAGAVDFLEPGDTVELTCDVEAGRCAPHRFDAIPAPQMELIRRVKYYERRGAQAIINRDKDAAVECLMLHPLVNSWSLAVELADTYFQQNAPFMREAEGSL